MTPGAQCSSAGRRTASSARVSKRKRESEASTQRQVARKLQQCADVTDAFSANQRLLNAQFQRYKTQKARAEELHRLHLATELTTQFQTLFGAEMDHYDAALTSQMLGLRKRVDKMLRKVASKKRPAPQKTQKVISRLPRLMERATCVVSERRTLIQEEEELPGQHQWIPKVLWQLYEDVVQASRQEKEMKPFKSAMHGVMRTLKETNPFFFLQVLYQPPPEYLDGQLEIKASKKLTAIAASMTPYLVDLKRRSAALRNKRDSHVRIHFGWNKLRFTLTFVKRAARHFHFLMLHVYAVALGCEAGNEHAGTISEKAARGFIGDDAKLRARLGLCSESAFEEDSLVRETYDWAPELLVYMDEWRRHREQVNDSFGLGRREQKEDFLPQFSFDERSRRGSRRIPRCDVLAEIGYSLRNVHRVWNASLLGTKRFKSMRIEEIGALETKIKSGFANVANLVYKMMLSRWMDRKKRPIAWWDSLELCAVTQPQDEEECAETLTSSDQDCTHAPSTEKAPPESSRDAVDALDDAQDATDVESVEYKEFQEKKLPLRAERCFRRPTTVTLRDVIARQSGAKLSDSVVPRPQVFDQKVWIRDVYAWTDDQIHSFERGSGRISEVRAAMLDLRDRLELAKLSQETEAESKRVLSFGDYFRDDWRVTCLTSHLRSLTSKAAAFAEETALHDASAALKKRPSLRETAENQPSVGDDEPACALEDSSVERLQSNVHAAHQHVAELLARYDGERSTEWKCFIQTTGRATAQLMRLIAPDGDGCELAVGKE